MPVAQFKCNFVAQIKCNLTCDTPIKLKNRTETATTTNNFFIDSSNKQNYLIKYTATVVPHFFILLFQSVVIFRLQGRKIFCPYTTSLFMDLLFCIL